MPRQQKQTVEYFSHYCDHKTTIYILEQKYGNDGYAFWFKLLEMLGKEEGHFLDLKKPMKIEFLQAKTKLDEITTCSILDLLAKLEAIDPELWEDKVIWSDNFVKGLKQVYANRRVDLPARPTYLHVETPRLPDNYTKESPKEVKEVKEVKEKKKRSEKNKSPLPDDFFISERVRAWAQKEGFENLDSHLESFKRKCRAKGYQYIEWDDAFMEAIRENWAKIGGGDGQRKPVEGNRIPEYKGTEIPCESLAERERGKQVLRQIRLSIEKGAPKV